MNRRYILILFVLAVGCESYNNRFTQKEYNENKSKIIKSDVLYYEIGGVKQKVKKLEYDQNDILRKETFFRESKTHRIKFYNENGYIVKDESYVNGSELNGQRVIYFPNGNTKEEYSFIDGQNEGKFSSYYENGTLNSDLEYSNGNLAGVCSWYYPNGTLMRIRDFTSEPNYKIEYYENGEKKSEGAFTGGDLFNRNIGRWVFYDKKGRITSEKNY